MRGNIMGFNEDVKQFAQRVSGMKDSIKTEQGTKMSMVVPFFQLLGYDVFNPAEFCPEYVTDVGIKKGEKIDYAILVNSVPTVLVECKWCGEVLDKHASQLFRYFATSPAKFGILTNGIIYRFYTDLEESNKMDLVPFLEIDMENLKESQLSELKKFCKSNFDSDRIFSTAEELKYTNLIRESLQCELENPTEAFVKCILNNVYEGLKTQKVIEKFTPIVKKSFASLINEIVNQRISSALSSEEKPQDIPAQNDTPETLPEEAESKIVTTEEEIEAFYIIRGLLAGVVPVEDVVYRDTESYFGILYKDNNRRPICRINLGRKNKQLLIPDENKKFERVYIDSLNDIYNYRDKLINAVKNYL